MSQPSNVPHDFIKLQYITIFRIDVEKVCIVNSFVPIANALFGNDHSESMLHAIQS